jgi:hypothetical protein
MPNKERTYNIDGIEYPSVTTVLNIIEKPWLAAWEKKEMGQSLKTSLLGTDLPSDKLERIDVLDLMIKEAKKFPRTIGAEAMDLGSRIHSRIENLTLNRKEKVEISEDEKIGVASWKLWKQESGMQIVETEKLVYDTVLGYAGTADAIFKDSLNRLCLIDYKTSGSGIKSDSFALQVAAYAQAYPEEISAGYIIMLNKEGKPDFAVHKVNLEVCFKAFVDCLGLYKEMKGGNLWIQ